MSKHEEIADSLTHDILVGQYRTGERLPSERDLAVRFVANRGAVREAMKKLEQLGLADIRPTTCFSHVIQNRSIFPTTRDIVLKFIKIFEYH